MDVRHLAKAAALLLSVTFAACGRETPQAAAVASPSAIVSNGVTATLSIRSDWGTAYCGNVSLVNGSSAAVTGWSVVLSFTNSTLSQLWSGSYTSSGGTVTVTPAAHNASIAPGGSTDFGFCATASGSPHGATLDALTVTGGSTSTSYTLTVTTSGSGSTSPAAGASSYPAGTVVQVSATPAAGYVFSGWSGAATGTTNPVSVTMDANKALTATFTRSVITSYTLTVAAGTGGTTSPAAGTYSYASGTSVQVTATPSTGYAFSGWSGAATGTANPVSVTMNANKTLTAAFTPTSTGSDVSINAGGSASGSFTADGSYSGGNTYSTTSTIDTSALSGAVPPQAVFQTERYGEFTYTIGNRAAGSAQTVTLYFQESYWSSAGSRTFDVAINGTNVLTAFDIYAAAGGRYKAIARTFETTANSAGQVVIAFTKGGGPDNPKVCGITVAGGGTGPTNPTLTVTRIGTGSGTVTGAGISCGSTCSATYTSGTPVTLTATAATGSTFAGWGGACGGTSACVVTMSASQSVTASFTSSTPTNPTLTVTRIGTGSGTVTGAGISCGSTCSASYTSGTRVTLTATAASGSTFGGWGGACSGTSTCVLTMSASQSVTASFTASTTSKYTVAVVQSTRAQATDLTTADVTSLVQSAISQAGGLDFIQDGQTVVLKPNLLTAYTDPMKSTPASTTVNGIDTDWRVAKAVADLVRARNPSGKILVMEGSVNSTTKAFQMLGYTPANFGSAVDEFIAIEGSSCADRTTGALEQRTALNGKQYWVNSRYVRADVVISLPVMKTHVSAGITGAVKNLGIGVTPVGQFSAGTNASDDCTRGQTASYIDHSTPETLGQFIRDYYSIRPADFVVMDALQGLEHGPLPGWDNSGSYDYASSRKNMRLILAGRNAVAVDAVASRIMACDPAKVPHLTKLAADGLGTVDAASITVVGKQVSEVVKPFAGKQTAICPGTLPTTNTRPGGACQAGATYAAPVLTGSPRLLYRPSGSTSGTFEGPVWLASSSALLFTDISFTGSVNPSQLLRSTTSGSITTVLADAGLNGMSLDASGTVYAASHKVQGIVRVNPTSATLTTVVDNVGGKKFNSPNDLVVRSDGTIYFTDPDFQLGSRTSETGRKGVYRVSPSGVVTLIDDTFAEPNGIALSPDETVLYVADYNGNAVRAFTVAADGSTSGKRSFATVSSPDGFAMDCLGNLYVASGSSGTIQVFSPSGAQLGSVSVATSLSNMAFGGADGRTLFITAGKALYALDMNLPGYFN